LPDYMIPSAFVSMSDFPMTPNRKIDRKALPDPVWENVDLGNEHVAPRNERETAVAQVWCSVLGIKGMSVHDSFFDLGGHSLKVLRVISGIEEALGIQLPPVALYDYPTIAGLCAFIESQGQNPIEGVALGFSRNEESYKDTKVDLNLIASIAAQSGNHKRAKKSQRPYRMRESWICRRILAPLYRIDRKRTRSLIQLLILKLEGGPLFTVTLRKLYEKYYQIRIGDYSEDCFDPYRMQAKTTIGRYTGIYPTVMIRNADHPRNTISTNALFYHPAYGFVSGYECDRKQVTIGNDVWIGHNATILYPTKTIGDGAVIAAGSVLVEDVPPYAIVAGYPAKVVKYRFSKERIEELLKSRWWDASLEELEPVSNQFMEPLEGNKIR